MNQSLVKVEKEIPFQFSDEDIELIKNTVAAGANQSEFKLFLYIAQRYTLDPLVKQIWLIKYGTAPAAIFTSRDGFLSIAHRSGQFDGMETEAVRNEKNVITGAICRVWRKDMTHPFVVEVSRSEYDTGKGNWQKMPETMIKKVAESQCLRRAFNISGLYDPSEFDPAESNQAVHSTPQPPKAAPVTPDKAESGPGSPEFQLQESYKYFSKRIRETSTLDELTKLADKMGEEITKNSPIFNTLKREYQEQKKILILSEAPIPPLVTEQEPEPLFEVVPLTCPHCDGPMDNTGQYCTSKGCGFKR